MIRLVHEDEINDREWARADNWSPLGLYRSARDTRVWVPKRNPAMGWTVNMAHRAGRVSLAALLASPIVITVAVWFAVRWTR
jgi:uncharacterized membrane protein